MLYGASRAAPLEGARRSSRGRPHSDRATRSGTRAAGRRAGTPRRRPATASRAGRARSTREKGTARSRRRHPAGRVRSPGACPPRTALRGRCALASSAARRPNRRTSSDSPRIARIEPTTTNIAELRSGSISESASAPRLEDRGRLGEAPLEHQRHAEHLHRLRTRRRVRRLCDHRFEERDRQHRAGPRRSRQPPPRAFAGAWAPARPRSARRVRTRSSQLRSSCAQAPPAPTSLECIGRAFVMTERRTSEVPRALCRCVPGRRRGPRRVRRAPRGAPVRSPRGRAKTVRADARSARRPGSRPRARPARRARDRRARGRRGRAPRRSRPGVRRRSNAATMSDAPCARGEQMHSPREGPVRATPRRASADRAARLLLVEPLTGAAVPP